MLPGWCNQTVTVLRCPETTAYGRVERSWANPTRTDVAGCSVQPAASVTDWGDPARVREIDAVLYAPPGADIREGDRISVDGRTYEVDGAPMAWASPTGAVSHVYCNLKAWSG